MAKSWTFGLGFKKSLVETLRRQRKMSGHLKAYISTITLLWTACYTFFFLGGSSLNNICSLNCVQGQVTSSWTDVKSSLFIFSSIVCNLATHPPWSLPIRTRATTWWRSWTLWRRRSSPASVRSYALLFVCQFLALFDNFLALRPQKMNP